MEEEQKEQVMSDGGATPSLSPLPSPETLRSMIGMLQANPEIIKSIAGALGSTDIVPEKADQVPSNEDTGDNDLSSKLGGILSALSEGSTSQTKEEAPESAESISASTLPSIPPELISKLPLLLSLMGGGAPKSKSEADREALLCALKPYLGKDKAEAIDRLIKLSRLGDLLKSL